MVRVLTQPEPGWQRIDDSDRNIIFEGENWFSGYSKYSDNYLKTFHYKSSSQPSNSVQIKFSFVGTKLRLIGLVNNGGYDRYATIVIDGNTERLDYDAWEGTRQAVIYEKTNLNKGPHTVTILGTYLNLDAIDIDSDGYVFTPKKVGEILDKPDPGWNRFDDADSLIKYGDGAWNRFTDDRYYNSTAVYSLTKSVVEFSFKGTGVRLVSKSVNLGYGPVDITIDGVKESYNPVLGSDNWKVLLYNKEGLKNVVHSVKLEGPEGIIMDAIDVLDGELVKTAKVGDVLLQPEIGWERIDDTDVNIKYSGNWTLIDNLPDYHNSTARFKHAKQSAVDNSAMSVTFKFKGTKLRVIGVSNNAYDRDAQIIIDGKPETISFYADRDVSPHRLLLFDKQGLMDDVHTIELKGVFMNLDAIDIDENGAMVPPTKVGDVLLQPESRWTRFDDRHSLIKYGSGTWELATDSRYYNSTNTFSRVSCDIEFSFKGTGLRIVSKMITTTSGYGPVDVLIDGVTEKYSITGSSDQWQTLLYEKQGLPDAVHSVKLVAPNGIIMDAIDVLGGELVKPPAKVGDLLPQPEMGWKRIDDSDANIKYVGNEWLSLNITEQGHYMDTFHTYPKEGPKSIEFKFTGTKLRIIASKYTTLYDAVSIKIDGVTETYSQQDVSITDKAVSGILVYDKQGLLNTEHSVIITVPDNKPLTLDAIDIDANGLMVKPSAKVGDQLLQPETGWTRINNSDASITATGFTTGTDSSNGLRNCYMNDYIYSKDSGTVTFEFTGTGLRVLGLAYSNHSSNIAINIDGVSDTFSEDYSITAELMQGSVLVYEKLNLENKTHKVTIYNADTTKAFGFDAFDILKPTAKVGDKLTQPESGWKRYDDQNSLIKYTGAWTKGSAIPWHNGTYSQTTALDTYAEFSFKGTSLRVIATYDTPDFNFDDVKITIDGITETYTTVGPSYVQQTLVFEKLGLSDAEHTVKIAPGTPKKSGLILSLDAIDVNETGELVKPTVGVGDQLTQPESGWRRIDDTNSNIKYYGSWSTATSDFYYNKTIHYRSGTDLASCRFAFTGKRFRLFGSSKGYFVANAILRIDDTKYDLTKLFPQVDENIHQTIIFEALNLTEGSHVVELVGSDLIFDCIDIDENGLIKTPPVKVGEQLLQPELGWKRIDDTDPLIRYIGNWKLTTGNDKHYNKTTHYNLDKKLDTSFEFEFVGTKLRLLAYGDSGYDATSKVLIDGKEETMVYNSPSGNQVIRYEKIGLDRGKHTVKVIGKAMSLDSIDIDADGYLLARLGDKLVEPEPGWVRFDDTHKNIEYNGFWKTTEGDVSCYNNTHHWKSKEDNNDSTISARFLFKGTKFRLISMTSPSYPEDIELKIDGQKEILKLSGEGMQYQTFAYEKKNLEDMIHVIELSGKYISIDAIDLEEGATLLKLPDEKLKPYQIRSGLIYKDDFDTFDSRWIASPVGSYSLIDRKGYFRMLHNVSRDTLLLADLPNEKEFAFEVSADYTPTHEDDKGGIIVWKNGEENIEFLETEDGTRETTELKWMACKDNEDWTFFSDYGEGFNFYDSDRMNCSKFGVVLKKGSNSKFINLDIDSIIATRGRKLTIANIAPNISVEMEDEFGKIIFNGNTGYNTGIQITLPSLEFAGKVILKNVEGKELGVIKNTFYGGDVYGFGSNLEIKFSGEELSTLAQTRLPDMISGKSEIMLELVNPSVARANNVNLSIAQYEDKFGWSWADLALDSNGKPGQYQDSINIPYVNPEKTIKFWLKVTKGTDYVGLAPLQFQIHLEHE
ncbi:hypothetical protein [Bacillus cereus]|uniref:hypothetical protein n=2 Tax=Bacillaceae TaxID=186817 RepID=UPI00211D720A|nr:hypothetical protein [Bacillus cereus]